MPDYEAAIGKSIKGRRIGIPKEYRIDGMPAEIEKLWQRGAEWLKAAGAELVEVSLPHTKYASQGLNLEIVRPGWPLDVRRRLQGAP